MASKGLKMARHLLLTVLKLTPSNQRWSVTLLLPHSALLPGGKVLAEFEGAVTVYSVFCYSKPPTGFS